jgi:hypothetical protein
MRALRLGLIGFFLTTATVHAQIPVAGPGARVGWDHDRVNTTRFEGQVDGGASQVVHNIGFPTTNVWTLPALTAGNHTIEVRACNAAGCSAWSSPLTVQVIVVPGAAPTNLRLLPATINSASNRVAQTPIEAQLAHVRRGEYPPASPGVPRFE